jgi:hypothetical protein
MTLSVRLAIAGDARLRPCSATRSNTYGDGKGRPYDAVAKFSERGADDVIEESVPALCIL